METSDNGDDFLSGDVNSLFTDQKKHKRHLTRQDIQPELSEGENIRRFFLENYAEYHNSLKESVADMLYSLEEPLTNMFQVLTSYTGPKNPDGSLTDPLEGIDDKITMPLMKILYSIGLLFV